MSDENFPDDYRLAQHDVNRDDVNRDDAARVDQDGPGPTGARPDELRVALIKSLSTNNRFYALVTPQSGIVNADVIDDIPHDLVLGIAYPCLEDGLNDFAVVRTAYETLELYPDEEALRDELHEIIEDARGTLIRRLMELLERIIARKAYFLGTDLKEFKTSALDIIHRGFPRQSLDQMMKVNVFTSVAQATSVAQPETQRRGTEPDPRGASLYRYEFYNSEHGEHLAQLSGREFLLSLLADVLDSVMDKENYVSKYSFDRYVFQQFIALIFVTYSSTNAVFYGIHKDDYGVSREKDMEHTPLYVAIGQELRRLTGLSQAKSADIDTHPDSQMWADIAAGIFDARDTLHTSPQEGLHQPALEVPAALAHEELILGHIASICAMAQQILKHKTTDSSELAQIILDDAARLVDDLKQIKVISPLAYNPGHLHLQSDDAPRHPSTD